MTPYLFTSGEAIFRSPIKELLLAYSIGVSEGERTHPEAQSRN